MNYASLNPQGTGPDRYYVRAANGATIDLLPTLAQAAKVAKENKASVWMLRAGKLARIA